MNVLIACEFSGIVRDAMRALGHAAWSCDFEEPEGEFTNYHFHGDCLGFIYDNPPMRWDLLIAHPPCTFLCNSGVRWLYKKGGRDEERWENMRNGARFFKHLLNAPIHKIAVENPIMHSYARQVVGSRPNQIIQPWQFGHGETKATCLWLKNLPPLKPTKIVSNRNPRVHYASPGPNRWKERSRTLKGIASAMAEQWTR